MNFLKKNKFDFIAIGGATEDLFIYTKEAEIINNKKDVLKQKLIAFEYGAKVLVDQAENSFGGGAVNAAVAFSRLGFNTSIVTTVGSDNRGKDIIKNIKDNRIDTGLIQIIKDQISGYSAIIVAGDKEHVAFPVRGANHYLVLNKKVAGSIKKSKYIYLTSLSGDWQKTLDDIFKYKGNAKIAWNPGHIQLSAGSKVLGKYLEETYSIILNIDEARELILSTTSKKKATKVRLDDIEEIAKAIASMGPEIVVVTDSAKGAVAYSAGELYKFKPKKISNALNTIGVGDAFGSSFIAGMELFHDLDKALKLAGANSARVVMSHGAQPGLMFRKQINDLKL